MLVNVRVNLVKEFPELLLATLYYKGNKTFYISGTSITSAMHIAQFFEFQLPVNKQTQTKAHLSGQLAYIAMTSCYMEVGL